MSAASIIRVGIDTGGTFTDFVVLETVNSECRMRVFKCPSTPDAPERAILQGLKALGLNPADTPGMAIVHGSTVATNAVLERKGARVAYVANAGLADILTLGRQARAELYNLQPQPQPPPVPEALCFEVRQRTAADGSEVAAFGDGDIEHLVNVLSEADVQAVAVNLLFSYLNDAPEQQIREQLKAALPDLLVCLSSEVLPEQREYERGMATWLNASVAPLISRYLQRLKQALGGVSLSIMQSSARSIDAGVAARRAVNLLLSGPAGGLLAARHLGGGRRLLTFDMGGTSTDVALIDGELRLTGEGRLARWPVCVPMVDMHTIGAGGGSIARVDAAGMLQVGPESAGAVPGPVCYGKGGREVTVTDANLVLGRLPADARLGGELRLDEAAAQQALTKLGRQMNCDAPAAARAVIMLANEHMVEALRVISVQRGEDPADYTLLSFGGAGGLHVCALAEALGMRSAVAPVHAGVLSALGMLVARPGRELSHGLIRQPGQQLDGDAIETVFRDLETRAWQELALEGVDASSVECRRQADLRYLGQSHALLLDWQGIDATEAAFHDEHERRYGHRLDMQVEWVNLRVSASAPVPELVLPPLPAATADPVAAAYQRVVGEDSPVPVYQREALCAGQRFAGPAIVSEDVATTFIDRGWFAEVDEAGNLLLAKPS